MCQKLKSKQGRMYGFIHLNTNANSMDSVNTMFKYANMITVGDVTLVNFPS